MFYEGLFKDVAVDAPVRLFPIVDSSYVYQSVHG